MTLTTLDDTTIAGHLARIDADGYTIIEDAIEPELVARLRDTIRRLERELHVEPRQTAAEGHATLRMYNLLRRIRCSRRCRCTPTCCRSPNGSSTTVVCSRA